MVTNNDAFIQARMSSTRLPGKVLKLIDGKTVLWHVINRLKFSNNITKIVVLTSTDKSDDEIFDYCKEKKFLCFRGELDDVLKRFYHASNFYNSDNIIRITADCPLIDPVIVDELIDIHSTDSNDYTFLCGEFPDGLDCSIFSYKCLKESHLLAKKKYEREHISQFVEKNEANYKIGKLIKFSAKDHIRITLDEPSDLLLIKKIFKKFKNKNFFDSNDIIKFLESNPDFLNINSNIIRNEGLLKSLNKEK
jgi:spore coat polysaccharide biosynthesis protein SpsF